MLPSTADEIYKVEKILGKWSYLGNAIVSRSRGFKIIIFPCRVGPNHGGASYVTNLKCPVLYLAPSVLKTFRRPCEMTLNINREKLNPKTDKKLFKSLALA